MSEGPGKNTGDSRDSRGHPWNSTGHSRDSTGHSRAAGVAPAPTPIPAPVSAGFPQPHCSPGSLRQAAALRSPASAGAFAQHRPQLRRSCREAPGNTGKRPAAGPGAAPPRRQVSLSQPAGRKCRPAPPLCGEGPVTAGDRAHGPGPAPGQARRDAAHTAGQVPARRDTARGEVPGLAPGCGRSGPFFPWDSFRPALPVVPSQCCALGPAVLPLMEPFLRAVAFGTVSTG